MNDQLNVLDPAYSLGNDQRISAQCLRVAQVVIKGTEYFDGKSKSYVDFPITDVVSA